jgi:hypothetical protein
VQQQLAAESKPYISALQHIQVKSVAYGGNGKSVAEQKYRCSIHHGGTMAGRGGPTISSNVAISDAF